jgi:lipoate-protein ligase A
MIHASLLYDFPLELIDRYTRMPPKRPAYRGDRPHAEFVTNLPMPRESLVAAITAAWVPGGVGAAPLARVPEALVADLLEKKFADRGWIERL